MCAHSSSGCIFVLILRRRRRDVGLFALILGIVGAETQLTSHISPMVPNMQMCSELNADWLEP